MLRSMYSGISGMKVNQTKLDVIGNNISNVGTTSFKASRTRFSDMLSQNVSDAMAPSANVGGKNSSQVGMGVQLASIDSVMTQGMMQPTGRALDVGIDGDGFFMVSKGPAVFDKSLQVNHTQGQHTITDQSLANSGTEVMYSRDGAFILDEAGNLLTGDGFRVMGYSLTNDDSSQDATGIAPNAVNTAGLDFRFGPGSQLNGYKVVLGSVGPGTVTSSTVDKAQKLVIVNGDFSTPGALTSEQVENAVNKGLSSAGISQQVFVKGKPTTIADLGSETVKGGSDATSPDSVSVMGATFTFSEGSELNDYTIKVGNISARSPKATVDKGEKTITIDANFVEKGIVTSSELGDVINRALKAEGINQQVTGSGPIAQLPGLVAKTDDKGQNAAAPTGIDTGATGYKMDFVMSAVTPPAQPEKGGELNGYSFAFTEDNTSTAHKMTIDKDSKKIQISVGTGTGATALTAGDINAKLKDWGLNDVEIDPATFRLPAAGAITGTVKVPSDGKNLTAPKSVTIAEGFTIKLPKGDAFNNAEVQIASLDDPSGTPTPPRVEIQTSGTAPNMKITKITLRGDFRDQNIQSTTLENDINAAILASGVYGAGPLTDNQKVSITGSAKPIKGLESTQITGGQENEAPGNQSLFGFEFAFGNGGSLNGYKINIGQITAGTKTSASIDEKSKTITVNGDFVTAGKVTAEAIRNVVNVALQEKGIDQTVRVTGSADTLGNVESDETLGGTPVNSMNADGTINFVDATGDLKSYDGELKTLRIPDKVRIPGTDQELRVKTYTIDKSGVINGVLEDGRVAALGQIAMASFKNPEGLSKLGGNLYSSSVNSGNAIIKTGVGTLGDDNSKGYGDNLQGMLEMSNVDLAEQFTDMIVSTRAFQAAGKMITTGDEILQDIINLKR